MTFASKQPKHGDQILHCGHINGPVNWLYMPKANKFTRPDGTTGMAHWIAACDRCFRRNGNPTIRGDGIWQGDTPIIKKNSLIPEGRLDGAN
jgi:hypothetical protein